MNTWSSANAKRNFAKVLRSATLEPQIVLLRGKQVGVVVSYESFARNKEAAGEKTLTQWLDDLSALHGEEGDMELAPRHDRIDQFRNAWE